MPNDIRHDRELCRPVQVFTLCPKCNKEHEAPTSKMLNGIFSAVHCCPHCGARVDAWFRISVGIPPEPKGADLHVRMALSCLEELEPEAMSRKARMVRNFNEHMERDGQLSAARVSLDRALEILARST